MFFKEIQDFLSFTGYIIIVGSSLLNILGNKKPSTKEINEDSSLVSID